ncbi:hypothetical protein, partial [Phocaeicola coprocola]|uniref:hypothetical protein n=1 Tax=Phocaeicola coprocola TaxID=310298 RepID=UPI0022E160BB
SKQYFTSIKNNPHEISTDPQSSVYHFPKSSAYVSEKMYKLCHLFVQIILSFVQTSKKFVQSSSKNSACFS